MKKNVTTNLILLVITAIFLIAVNATIWFAAERGLIAGIDNVMIWGLFVGVNIISLIWAISLLGLQPLVVTLSYAAGCGIAWFGIREMPNVNMAEIMTAGATYGAFGVLAVGNATAKVRLAFFNKGQVPFALVMVGLLVVDGLLNSRVSHAGLPVLLNAVAYPFLVAGVVPGVVLLLARKRESGERVEADEAVEHVQEEIPVQVEVEEPIIAVAEEVVEPIAEPVAVEPEQVPKIIPIEVAAVKEEPLMKEAEEPETKADESYIPFDIDGSDEEPIFGDDLKLLESMVLKEEEEEATTPAVLQVVDAEPLIKATETQDVVSEKVIDIKTATVDENVETTEAEKGDDWLSGHLELLQKIK